MDEPPISRGFRPRRQEQGLTSHHAGIGLPPPLLHRPPDLGEDDFEAPPERRGSRMAELARTKRGVALPSVERSAKRRSSNVRRRRQAGLPTCRRTRGLASRPHLDRNAICQLGSPASRACGSDRGSGAVMVEKLTIVVDAGTVVDPDGALAQVEGAALWGLSMALHEGSKFVQGQVKVHEPRHLYARRASVWVRDAIFVRTSFGCVEDSGEAAQ